MIFIMEKKWGEMEGRKGEERKEVRAVGTKSQRRQISEDQSAKGYGKKVTTTIYSLCLKVRMENLNIRREKHWTEILTFGNF